MAWTSGIRPSTQPGTDLTRLSLRVVEGEFGWGVRWCMG
jgi:hypothetical protein